MHVPTRKSSLDEIFIHDTDIASLADQAMVDPTHRIPDSTITAPTPHSITTHRTIGGLTPTLQIGTNETTGLCDIRGLLENRGTSELTSELSSNPEATQHRNMTHLD